MAQTSDEIAKDIVVAWLSHNSLSSVNGPDGPDGEKTGERIGKIYKAVLQEVKAVATS